MRLREFLNRLNEDAGGDGDAGHESQGGRSSNRRAPLDNYAKAAIPGLTTVPDWPGHYYSMYRMGIHLASSPVNPDTKEGPFSNDMVFSTYTNAEEDMIKHSAKKLGVKLKTLSSQKSTEANDTNVSSPIAKVKRNKHGI
jgi:hypothetical protein